VHEQHLHLFNTTTGTDASETHALPIVNDNSAVDVPFLVSRSGEFVATMHGTTLTEENLASGESNVLTEAIDGQRRSGYGWSPTGVLAYAEVDSNRSPVLHLFDPKTGANRVLLQGQDRGVFSGVSWSTSDWLIFVFWPSGTEGEELAEYRAINVITGANELLVMNGSSFNLSASGRKLTIARSPTASAPFSIWVATLVVQQ
jgi:hypothetical protein